MQRFRMKHYQRNILAAFLQIVILSALVFTLIMTFFARGVLEKNYRSEKNLQAEQMCRLADEIIYTTIRKSANELQYQYLFVHGASFRQLAEQGYSANMKTVFKFYQQLEDKVESHSIITQAALYFPVDGCIVSSEGFLTDSRNERFSYMIDFHHSALQEGWITRSHTDSSGLTSNVITFMKKIMVRSLKTSVCHAVVLAIDIPHDTYLEKVAPLNGLAQDTLFILDQDNSLLLSSGEMQNEETLALLKSELPDRIFYKRQDILISQKQSDLSNWRFVLFSVNNSYNLISRSLSMSILLSLLAMLFLIAMAFILSRRLYRPFQTLLHRIGVDAAADKHDEMTLIDESFQMLNQQLDKSSEQISKTQWYMLLHSPLEAEVIVEPEGSMSFSLYYVLLVQSSQPCSPPRLESYLHGYLGNSYEIAVVPLENQTSAVILNTDYDEAKTAEQIRAALDQLSEDEEILIWASMGEAQDTLYTLAISYREAVDTLQYRILHGSGMFLTYSEQSVWPDFCQPVPAETLMQAIRDGESDKALAVFDSFMRDLLGEDARWSIHSIEIAVTRFYYGLREISNRLQIIGKVEELETFQQDMRKGMDPLIRHMRQTLESMVSAAGENSSPEMQNCVLKRICTYIDENLDQDLSLPELARIGGQNVSYVSTQFKKAYGIGIVKYINQKRLEKACFLLRGSELNVDEVARSVGFRNTSYFIKRFSQEYHVTPKNYKLQSWNSD